MRTPARTPLRGPGTKSTDDGPTTPPKYRGIPYPPGWDGMNLKRRRHWKKKQRKKQTKRELLKSSAEGVGSVCEYQQSGKSADAENLLQLAIVELVLIRDFLEFTVCSRTVLLTPPPMFCIGCLCA